MTLPIGMLVRSIVIATLTVACHSGPPAAPAAPPPPKPPDQTAARERMEDLHAAIETHDPKAVHAMFAATVRVDGLDYGLGRCRRRFRSTQTVETDQLDDLARCVIALNPGIPGPRNLTYTQQGLAWWVELRPDTCRSYRFELIPRGDGTLAIAAVEADGTCVEHVAAAPPPVPPPPPSPSPTDAPPPIPPQNVPPTLLDHQRIEGEREIEPDGETKRLIWSTQTNVIASMKYCVAANGSVTSVTVLKSSGYPDYDQKLVAGIKAWRFNPYLVNGSAVPVCTAVTFIY